MSEVTQASTLTALVATQTGERYWLVVEQQSETLRQLYTLDSTPDVAWLFDETRYASARDVSPLVVATQPGTALWNAYVEGQGAAPLAGIAVASSAERDVMLSHLRHRLDAIFYGSRRGLLRYYDPWVAAHLFADASSSLWLGPLSALFWYGGTFHQRAHHGAAWYACRPASTAAMTPISDTGDPLSLSPNQEESLEAFMAQYPLWQRLGRDAGLDEHSAEHAQRFVAALNEAQRLSIPEHDISDFVLLRFEHYQAPLPDDVDKHPAEARLATLQRHFHIREENTTIGRDRA
ncbi:DUF4123 domain-containing protein [Billgrantia montanilacus]|uniref:DUF4123 domain-containing protein n=1 Tax=Billgrantia montanilacus TaxID=2282305 RepID=A0A368U0H3_9GAMM|nr:DUF4123 domain-containing protein [Halomonas montanilacus]RCV88593.1 DUF4123 domain-containing protein [Halomonas montanilacus]